jgi:ADP-heptose:LPS heptosyltransferase
MKIDTIYFQGGVGKHFAFSSLLSKIKEKYGSVYIVNPHPAIFEDQIGVKRSVNFQIPYGYEDYFKDKEVIWLEPYSDSDFFNQRIHLIESCAKQLDLEYDEKTDRAVMPILNSYHSNETKKITDNIEDYIIIQFKGGNANSPIRNYPDELIKEFIELFFKKYKRYRIINFGAEDQQIEHKQIIPSKNMPFFIMPHLLKKAKAFVSIDSSLQHMSNCKDVNTQGVVLWGDTSPVNFGYSKNVNMELCNNHPTRPYFTMPTSDFTSDGQMYSSKDDSSMRFEPEEIIEELTNIL